MTDPIQFRRKVEQRPRARNSVPAKVIPMNGEPTPEEDMTKESRLAFYKKQLKYVVDELCALMPAAKAKTYLEFLIANAIEDNYK